MLVIWLVFNAHSGPTPLSVEDGHLFELTLSWLQYFSCGFEPSGHHFVKPMEVLSRTSTHKVVTMNHDSERSFFVPTGATAFLHKHLPNF